MSDNLEKEIEELLKKIDDFPSSESATKKRLKLYLSYLGIAISKKTATGGKVSRQNLTSTVNAWIILNDFYFVLYFRSNKSIINAMGLVFRNCSILN